MAEPAGKQSQQAPPARTNSFVYMDAQNLDLSEERDKFIKAECKRRFPSAHLTLNAFARPNQGAAIRKRGGWSVKEDKANWDQRIAEQARVDTRKKPKSKVVFLITMDKGFAALIRELKQRGVRVYLFALGDVSPELVAAVGKRSDHPPVGQPPFYAISATPPTTPLAIG